MRGHFFLQYELIDGKQEITVYGENREGPETFFIDMTNSRWTHNCTLIDKQEYKELQLKKLLENKQ